MSRLVLSNLSVVTRRFLRLLLSRLVLFCQTCQYPLVSFFVSSSLVSFCQSCQCRLISSCFVSIVSVHSSIYSFRPVSSRLFCRPFLCVVLSRLFWGWVGWVFFVFPPPPPVLSVDFFVSSCFVSLVNAVHWSFVDFSARLFLSRPSVLLCQSPLVLSSKSCRVVSLALSFSSCLVSSICLVKFVLSVSICQSRLVFSLSVVSLRMSCQSPLVSLHLSRQFCLVSLHLFC